MDSVSDILKKIDWKKNIELAFDDSIELSKLECSIMRIAVWSRQLELSDTNNPALCFVREMQVAAQQTLALLGLCVYKASAATSRAMLENCIYYTYFRTHYQELETLLRVERFHLSKADILEYHKIHTSGFMASQECFGLIGNLDQWYSKVSAIIHGQIPGVWNAQSSLSDIRYDKAIHSLAIESFLTGEGLIHQFLFCTSGRQLWNAFAPDAKSFLIKGMAGNIRTKLGLDAA